MMQQNDDNVVSMINETRSKLFNMLLVLIIRNAEKRILLRAS